MATIDRNITITHDVMKARFDSDGKQVSDLYLWKHYRALVLENERLQREVERAEQADYEATIASFEQGYGRF